MLGEADGGIGAEGEAGQAGAIEVRGFQPCGAQQPVQCAPDPPMRAVDGIAFIRHRNGCGDDDTLIALPHHRRFNARVSIAWPASSKARTLSRSTPRWILLVEVTGMVSTKAT